MRILITGANGFIGKHLTPRLIDEGHTVALFLHKSSISKTSKGNYKQIVKGDLSSGEGLDQVYWESFDAIIHLACAGVKSSQRVWDHCINTNIVGTKNLLNAISKFDKSPLIIYPRTFYENYLDQFPVLKNNPYMSTKRETTRIIEEWATKKTNARVCLPTIYQAYGSGDDPQNVLTYTINQLKINQHAHLSSGDGLRDWIYINDLVNAFVKILKKANNKLQYYDFGTGKLISIKEVVSKIALLLNKPTSLLQFDPQNDRGDGSLKSKATRFCPGWVPKYSIDEGLRHFLKRTMEEE